VPPLSKESGHIVTQEEMKFVFLGQPLMSFYLQVHNTTRDEDADRRLILKMCDLVRAARRHGLLLDHKMRVQL
jgi:hypothetical protein